MDCYNNEFFLNSGFGGAVHAARNHCTDEIVAIKTVKRTQFNVAAIDRETLCARALHHPNIIKTFEIIQTDSKVQYVQEFAEGGDLFDYLQQSGCVADEARLKSWFGQIACGLEYMHSLGFCHRDIKPENIVLMSSKETGEQVAKLIDFGLAEPERYVRDRVGSNSYTAPEVTSIRHGEVVDGFAADVWSLGIVLIVLLSGRIPWSVAFNEDSDFAAFSERRSRGCKAAVFHGPINSLGLSVHLVDLLDSMLDPNPTLRPSMSKVLDLISLPWIKSMNTNVNRNKEHREKYVAYTYRLQSTGDSGCSWGDISLEDEVDFSLLPLPSFEPVVGERWPPAKIDSGVSFQ